MCPNSHSSLQVRHLNQDCKGDASGNLGDGSCSLDSVKPEGIQRYALRILSQKLEQYARKGLEFRGPKKTCMGDMILQLKWLEHQGRQSQVPVRALRVVSGFIT